MRIFNTLTRKKEEFVPQGNKVAMYSCGPTVYNYAHIGNMRTYIFMDIFRRVLKYNGYKIKGVINITDVGHLLSDADEGEDKMQVAAQAQNKSPYEIAKFYEQAFFEDCKKLNLDMPEIVARATDHIPEMVAYTQKLLDLGFAYRIDDGIYFDISKFEGYGKLSGVKLEGQEAGARVEVNSQKRHPADFALWKNATPQHIMQWDTPLGKGFPGWHIECSAMAKKYLGACFDIHTGGIDAVPIHHENEIAQSEALEGKKTVNYWVHGEFMMFDSGKMSKSLGNGYTIDELATMGYSALDFRYFCLNAQYRKRLNFTFEALNGAKTALERLYGLLHAHKGADATTLDEVLLQYKQRFEEAINDDLNIPLALGELWSMLKEPKSHKIYELALVFDKVFGLNFKQQVANFVSAEAGEPIPAHVTDLANERLIARKNKDFALSDAIRAQILQQGYEVRDTANGFVLTKK